MSERKLTSNEDKQIPEQLAALGKEPAPTDRQSVARVMQFIETHGARVPWSIQFSNFLFGRRSWKLSYTLSACAGVAVCTAALVLLPTLGGKNTTTRGVAECTESSPGFFTAKPVEANRDNPTATFRLPAPYAKSVSVVGDFNNWTVGANILSDADGDGIWLAQFPLAQGKYAYTFVVNETQWVVDPDAASLVADGFGGVNAVLKL